MATALKKAINDDAAVEVKPRPEHQAATSAAAPALETVPAPEAKPEAAPEMEAASAPETGEAEEAAPAPKASPRRPHPPHRVTRIAAVLPWHETGLGEVMRAHELLRVFTWRQINVQYKQATLGIGWALLSPLLSTLVYTFVFGKLAPLPSEGYPYPVFVLSGLITWQFFSRALSMGSQSILGNSHIITKVYFPRMILPLSAVLSGLVDYVVTLFVLVALMLFYGFTPGPAVVTLPLFVLLATIVGFAFTLWLSALNALYRDIGFMVPIVLQAWMFMTPVIYPAHLVPQDWVWIMQINPMTPIVEGARWAMLPVAPPPDLASFAILAAEVAVLFLGGIVTFRKVDAILADRI
jgi:lipopolysaccharide transport system permease protein